MSVWCNGNTTASKPVDQGSIPWTDANLMPTYPPALRTQSKVIWMEDAGSTPAVGASYAGDLSRWRDVHFE